MGRFPFFRAVRRGGVDLATLEKGEVVLNETKFANHLQFDDFTSITENMRSNIEEVLASVRDNEDLARADKAIIEETLQNYLKGGKPANLKVRVVTGKSAVGPRLQKKLQKSTDLPVEFVEHNQ
jgi:hypothetical protein